MIRKTLMICCTLVQLICKSQAQDSLPAYPGINALNWREDGTDRDGSDAIEEMMLTSLQPIDLNKATVSRLAELPGLAQSTAQSIVQHRERFGEFLCIEELQVIPGLSAQAIRALRPHIRIRPPGPWKISGSSLRQEVVLRLSGAGTTWSGTSEQFSNTAGDGFRGLIRYRAWLDERWSAGFRVEKDPGEAWLDQRKRPDYTAGFISYRGNGLVRKMVLGDFALQYGQGVLCWIGFGTGFTSDPAFTRRQARGILPYTSSDENAGLRGVAVNMGGKKIELDFFVSHRRRDASRTDDSLQSFASFQSSGIHSTESEIRGKSSLPVSMTGMHLTYRTSKSSLGMTGLAQRVSGTWERETEAYARFRNLPNQVFAGALDGTTQWRNATLFFETGIREGSMGIVSGVQIALGKHMNAGIQYRRYGNGRISLYSDAIAENARNENEEGVVFAIQSRILPACTVQVLLQHTTLNWLRYQIDQPGMIDEQQVNLLFNPNRRTQFRLRYRRRTQPSPESGPTPEQQLIDQARSGVRLSMTTTLPPFLLLEARIEQLRDGDNKGWMAFTDWSVRPLRSRVSGTIRFAIAETSSYTTAIYSQEPEVLYGFSMPGYYGSMFRMMTVIKCRMLKGLDFYLRSGWTVDANASSLKAPNGSMKSDLSIQLRWTHGDN